MVQDPHWRKARLHPIATAFQHLVGISHQLGNSGLEYRHQPTGHDHQQPPVSRKFGLTINKGKTEVQMITKESKQAYVRLH